MAFFVLKIGGLNEIFKPPPVSSMEFLIKVGLVAGLQPTPPSKKGGETFRAVILF